MTERLAAQADTVNARHMEKVVILRNLIGDVMNPPF
jgi:hypothetical protein